VRLVAVGERRSTEEGPKTKKLPHNCRFKALPELNMYGFVKISMLKLWSSSLIGCESDGPE
jgi:hypothetical protein